MIGSRATVDTPREQKQLGAVDVTVDAPRERK